ncbi:MAG: type II secretion system F family protein [Gordonia sp. (in: high G+C Gram-positive bacteria)]
MTGLPLALLAVALWIRPGSRWQLCRVIGSPPPRSREPRWLGARVPDDPFALAATLDLLAVCLTAGLPVATAVRVAATGAPRSLACPLQAAAELLELGAEPERAWEFSAPVPDCLTELATLARRSARAGSALSAGVAELADEVRRGAHDAALARAEKAGVMVSGPLGLCFLPAFICLGIVPVVVGLASQTLGNL